MSPSAQDTVTASPPLSKDVASPHPTTAGMPNSRATIAAWQGRPPRENAGVAGPPAAIGDNGRGALHHRFPIWVGHVCHQHIARLYLGHFAGIRHQTNFAAADALTDGATADQ